MIRTREQDLLAARLYLTEARSRRLRNAPGDRSLFWMLLSWTANARLRAIKAQAAQLDLFGGAA